MSFLGAHGYNILQPPCLINKEVMTSIAQFNDFDAQLYKVLGKTNNPDESREKYLNAPICAYHRNKWVGKWAMPI
jgi:seryl-tRNA synthetase